MKIRKITFAGCLVLLLISLSGFAQQKTVTVSGKVVDSITNAAIPNATILVCGLAVISLQSMDSINLSNLKYDTISSKTDGTFSASISMDSKATLLVFGALKQGYVINYSYTLILFNAVSLGTIKLQKVGNLAKDTIVVTGTVVDSATGIGIAGVQIIMSGLGSFDTAGNTAITDAQGKISKQVIVGNAATDRQLIYLISKAGYSPGFGKDTITGKTLDIGVIKLKSNGQSIIPRTAVGVKYGTNESVRIYSLRGQQLYGGNPGNGNTATFKTSGLMVTVYKNVNGVIAVKKQMIGIYK